MKKVLLAVLVLTFGATVSNAQARHQKGKKMPAKQQRGKRPANKNAVVFPVNNTAYNKQHLS